MVKVWDNGAEGGPVQVDMLPIHAKEAIERDPARYSYEKQTVRVAAKPAPAHEPAPIEPEPAKPAPTDPDKGGSKPKK